MRKEQAVVFCFDENYAKYCLVALHSLIVNSGTNFRIYSITFPKTRKEDLTAIDALCEKFKVEIKTLIISDEYFKEFRIHHHFSHANFIRLKIPELLKEESKVLYLDCDLIVHGNISEIFDIELGNRFYAGCLDPNGSTSTKVDDAVKKTYINSGMLLMNLTRLREDDSFEKMQKIYRANPEKITWVDQCLINLYAHQNTVILDNKYNHQVFSHFMKKQDWLAVKDEKLVHHFVGGVKPWHKSARIHLKDFWRQYADRIGKDRYPETGGNTVKELMAECRALEEYDRFKESSAIKDRIIEALRKHINQPKNNN